MKKYSRYNTVNTNRNYMIRGRISIRSSRCKLRSTSTLKAYHVSYMKIFCDYYYSKSNKENITNRYE